MKQLPPPRLPRWLNTMVPFQRYCVEIEGRRVHVMEQGAGRPVLLLHGNPTWGFLYRKVAAALKGGPFRLIMPDLVGLGFSDKPRTASVHTLENHISWMGSLIDLLDLEDLILVVQDWGGTIGLGALSERSGRLGGVVILNTVVGPPKPDFRPTMFHRISQAPVLSQLLFRGLGFPQSALRLAQGDKHSISGRVARAYRYPLRGVRKRLAPLAMARMVPDSHHHPSIAPMARCLRFVNQYDGPAAIVWGDNDPILGRVRNFVASCFPQAEVTQTQAGHFLPEEVPDEIAEAIRSVDAQSRD